MVVVALFALYVAAGYLGVPALVKLQLEKQVADGLGLRISVVDVRFDPFRLRLDIDDLLLSEPDGRPMVGFKRGQADFEIRSLIDRAWTFAHVTLEAPVLNFALERAGRHNFSALIERLREKADPAKKDDPLPRFRIGRIALTDGEVVIADRQQTEPLIARVTPVVVEISNLSSVPAAVASFRLSAHTAAGEALDSNGTFIVDAPASKGTISLKGLQTATLARGLARLVAVDAPAGSIDFSASFDIKRGADGAVAGVAQSLELNIAALSLNAPGGPAPLAAMDTFWLKEGLIDIGLQKANFASLRLAKGRIAASQDAKGRVDRSGIVRERAPAVPNAAAVNEVASAGRAAVAAARPWSVSMATVDLAQNAFGFANAATGHRANVAAVSLETRTSAVIDAAGTRTGFDKATLTAANTRQKSASQGLRLPAAAIRAERVTVDSTDKHVALALDRLSATASAGLAARHGEFAYEARRVELRAERVALDSTGAGLNGAIEKLKFNAAGTALRGPGREAQLGEVALESAHVGIKTASGRLDATIDKLAGTLAKLSARRSAEQATVDTIEFQGASAALTEGSGGAVKVALGQIRSTLAGLALKRPGTSVDLRGAVVEAKSLVAGTGGTAPGPSRTEVQVDNLWLDLTTLGLVAEGATPVRARIVGATLGAASLSLAVPNGPLEGAAAGLSATLSGGAMNAMGESAEWLSLGKASVSGGSVHLHDRRISAQKLTLADASVRTWIDAAGRFNWLRLLDVAKMAPATPAWRVAFDAVDLDGVAIGFQDRRPSSPIDFGLESIRARLSGVDSGATKPMQAQLRARIVSGGDVEANGNIRADTGTTDLAVKIGGLALAPLAPYLARCARLQLTSGTASAAGRLRYGEAAGGSAKFAYEGTLVVDKLNLEEITPKRPLLAWNSVAAADFSLSFTPNRVEIGELRVVGPSGRFIIAADQSVNISDVIKRAKDCTGAPDPDGNEKPSAKPAGTPKPAAAAETFPVDIARIRVSDGTLEFADLSLRPQFGTLMHDLEGVVTGLTTDPARSAQLQLDAGVDKFGSAKIRGRISVLRPEKFTDVVLAFRNLELTSLSPYVAKFAGYRIAGGRLALDLEYKVIDGKLVGENKFVLRQVELGEKVDSPGALDLPLELAIAVLTDADGVIDVGLPVSGDLNDPKFDYGAIIGKAIGSFLGGIVTAPFRALAALFGGGEKKLDAIEFEPGSDTLSPPERQKLEAVARALKARPTLKLIVPPSYAPAADGAALKSRALRTELARSMGIALAPGEDPGPVDTASPKGQSALDAAFSRRYAPEVLAVLKSRALALHAGGPQPADSRPPAAAGDTVRAPNPMPAFYQRLYERMRAEQALGEQDLAQLAVRRGAAIVREITTTAGAAASQVTLADVRQTGDENNGTVALHLELGVAK